MIEEKLIGLEEMVLLPRRALIKWRAPTANKSFPTPNTKEVVVLMPLFEQGFFLPNHHVGFVALLWVRTT